MTIDFAVTAGGLLVGIVVGMTGMGGGALMTPMLVLFFGIQPLAAVSSDLVVSLFMKPVGGFVHLRRGTVQLALVGWLCVGSVPAAFAGVLVLRALGSQSDRLNSIVKIALGVALLLAVAIMLVKGVMALRVHAHKTEQERQAREAEPLKVRPVITVVVGVIGGLVVGMTSVGSGSLIIVTLMLIYPQLTSRSLVGTDLVQAVPLVASAALGHLLFGEVKLGLTLSLLIGAVPGAWIGARLSSVAPQMIVRRVLAVVLLASGAKLVGLGNVQVALVILGAALVGPVSWMWLRTRMGLPALWRTERTLPAVTTSK
ncbi:sulfite exporter TauE/SafE family protein [soil metagenome]|jgi:uncharacterized membrane protein YfcA